MRPLVVLVCLVALAVAAGCADDDVDVMLTEVGDRPVAVIAEVRAATGLGLQEAKLLISGVPSGIVDDVPREEGERLVRRLERAGGSAELE